MKLDLAPSGALRTDTTTIGQEAVRTALRIIDAGHIDALRHFAEHGTLPPEAPVWDGATVRPDSYGWNVYNADGDLLASVALGKGAAWHCDLVVSSDAFDGETPQAAVDSARAWMRKRWCL